MSHLDQIHPLIAVLIALFVLIGTVLTLLGTVGLLRLGSFYERLHAPTLGSAGERRGSWSDRC